jgi:hypothetical protein
VSRVLTFAEAIADAEKRWGEERSVLLGNGFSIDYNSKIFRYESLAKEAALKGLSVKKEDLFRRSGSRNFEAIIERLRISAGLHELYGGDPKMAAMFRKDARIVRNGLAEVISARHPDSFMNLTGDEIRHARQFLSNFERYFTLSYDLLLYWIVNARDYPPANVTRRDGFEWPTRVRSTDFVWKVKPTYPQRVFYLHGALHYFIDGGVVHKLSYGSEPIVDGLRARLANGDYPLIVTEGTSAEKEARIDKSPLLRTGMRRFGELQGAVFIHGVSMSQSDDHILGLIEEDTSAIEGLYVGIHRPGTAGARGLMARAEEIAERREANGGRKLRLRFYDAATANAWRTPATPRTTP